MVLVWLGPYAISPPQILVQGECIIWLSVLMTVYNSFNCIPLQIACVVSSTLVW